MKRDDLLYALNICKSSLIGVDFIPVLSHFCFDGDTVYAYDDVSAVIVNIDTGIKGAVKGDALLGILQTCEEDVELKQGKDSLQIMDKRGKSTLPMLPEKEFMFKMPDIDETNQYALPGHLLEGFALCAATTGRDPRRPEFLGVTVMHSAKGNDMTLYSTDNITLSRFVYGKPKGEGPKYVLAKSVVQQMLDCAKQHAEGGDSPIMCVDDKHAIFVFDGKMGITVVTKILEYKGTDFDGIITQHAPERGLFPTPEGLDNAVKRSIVVLTKNAEKLAKLSASKGKMHLGSKSDLGEVQTTFDLEGAPQGEAECVVNAEMLLRALNLTQEMSVTDRSVVLRREDYTHIISAKDPQ